MYSNYIILHNHTYIISYHHISSIIITNSSHISGHSSATSIHKCRTATLTSDANDAAARNAKKLLDSSTGR